MKKFLDQARKEVPKANERTLGRYAGLLAAYYQSTGKFADSVGTAKKYWEVA